MACSLPSHLLTHSFFFFFSRFTFRIEHSFFSRLTPSLDSAIGRFHLVRVRGVQANASKCFVFQCLKFSDVIFFNLSLFEQKECREEAIREWNNKKKNQEGKEKCTLVETLKSWLNKLSILPNQTYFIFFSYFFTYFALHSFWYWLII